LTKQAARAAAIMSILSNIETKLDEAVSLRSAASAEFEAFWRSLPRKDDFVPKRTAFRPERAPKFLRDLVVCDVSQGPHPSIQVRLTGTAFDERVQQSVRGQDYLQFMPQQYREGVMTSVRNIVERPCGLWQIMPVHYQRGFAQNLEVTVFPLAHETCDRCQLLILTREVNGLITPRPTGRFALSADTASTYQYIDVGAGVPMS
jgi:hypothetical protein